MFFREQQRAGGSHIENVRVQIAWGYGGLLMELSLPATMVGSAFTSATISDVPLDMTCSSMPHGEQGNETGEDQWMESFRVALGLILFLA